MSEIEVPRPFVVDLLMNIGWSEETARLLFEHALDNNENGQMVRRIVRRTLGLPSSPVSRRTKLSPQLRVRVFEHDSFKCQSCDNLSALTIDHITPVSKGGSDEPENLQTLCMPCNRAKGVS